MAQISSRPSVGELLLLVGELKVRIAELQEENMHLKEMLEEFEREK